MFLGQDMGCRKPVFDIEITAQKKNVFTTVSQNELALQFFNLGFFNPQMAEPALLCLEMMEFDSKDSVMQKIAENAQLWQKLQMYMQMALTFAQQLDPMMAQTIAMDITKTLGAAPMAGPADGKAPQLVQADNITGLQKKEHAVVANARERAGNAGTPGGSMNKEG
jgi:hypothetical protein